MREYFRNDNALARILTFGMIPVCLKIFLLIGKLMTREYPEINPKLFGIPGILIGAFIGHLLYYYWLFPEKRTEKSID